MKINDFNSELELMKESDVRSEEREVSVSKNPMPEKAEILERRGSHSKTFQKKKGKFETIFYNVPVHHYDETKKVFVKFNEDMEETETAFETTNHGFAAVFHKQEQRKALFTIKRGNYQVCVSVKNQFGNQTEHPMPIFDQEHNRMHYANVSLDTDYDCSVTASGVKISVVKRSNQNARSTFVIAGDALRYVWNETDKVLRFISEESAETVFELPAPFMVDASGIYSENVSFEIVSVNDHVCELSVVPDMGWLSNKERAYPVSMEWSMISDEPVNNGFVFDCKNVSADGKIAIGGVPTAFYMYLPEQKAGMITKRVKALFHCETVPVAEDKDYLLVLNRVKASEAEPVTERIGVSMMSIGKSEYAFDVTAEYTADENTTYSLQLCEEQDGELVATEDTAVALMTLSADSAISTFSVEETDGTTEEDTSSGESGNIGSVGTYEVDLVSGKLNMEMKDFAWEGNRMPISISRSYKGQFSHKNYGSWSNANGSFGSMLLGYGWRMNLMQSMVSTGTQKIGDKYKDTYTYTDEAGEEIIFAQCECESGSATCTTYEDVDGLGYVYESATGVLTKGKETHTFSSGRLVKVIDEFGNTMMIHYSSGKISSVKDGVGRTFTFGYSGNYLMSITAPNGSSIQYQYSDGNLSRTIYPNNQILTFSYDTSDNQPSAVAVSGSGIVSLTTRFAYSNKIISEITTIANGTTAEKRTKFDIDSNGKLTIVTEIDGIDGAIDQIKKHKVYFHEYSDKNYTYYEAGSENKIAVSGSNGVILPYTEPGLEIGNLTCKNLLKNHNFNTEITDPVSCGWNTNLTEDYRDVQYDPPEKMPGYCAAYLVSLYSTDSQKGIWQTVNLTAGQSYVFSCYLKLAQGNSNPARGVYLMVKSANGTITYRSQMITAKKEFQRVALPFTVDAAYGLSYTVGIYIDGNVKAKAIAPQLEQGTTLSPYNYLASNVVTKYVSGSASCPNYVHVADVKVPAAKDARETFTLSGYAQGGMSYTTEGQETYAALKAVIYYQQTSEERRNDTYPKSKEFWVPIYTKSDDKRFVMVQFSKDQYRAIDYIKITCENNYNSYGVTFSDLQLIRNAYVDGLTEEDFIGNTDNSAEVDTETEDSLLTSSSDSEEDDVETIMFEEVLDAFGNALTGTNFKNGELGAIYTEQRFADSNPNDTLGDAGNNKTSEIDARGNETKYEYDPVTSKPTKVTDRCGHSTGYTYDASGRTTKVTAPNGGTVSYGYNSYDDLTSISRGDGQSYTMGYDAYRNLTSVNAGENNLVTYEYKSGGNRLKSMEYANGDKQTLTYDRFGNVIGEAWNGVMAYRYFYDASNQLVKTLDILGKKMYNINRVGENVASIEEYDVASINAATYMASGLSLVGTMHYSFDSAGKQFRKKYIDADGNEQKYVFEYRDEQNVAVQLPTGVVSHTKSDHLGRKVFDELQLGKGFMNRKFTYHEGVITDTHLDNDRRVSDPQTTLVKQIEFADGRTIQYEYDAEERITKVVDSVDGTFDYTYDALGQLLTENVNGVEVNKITYDSYGNIKTKNGVVYDYDTTWKDKLIKVGTKSITYDANGNPTNYLGAAAIWEKGRQLKQYGANTYKYNNDGIRIRKQTASEIHEYILDGTNIVKEIVTDTANCPKHVNEYLYDLDGTVCGLKHDGVAYYFYKNLQGDVIAITDDKGVTVARYTYDAWGKVLTVKDASGNNITSTTHVANINPFRYRSYYYDTEIELYYLQSRYYDPAVSRFINSDEVAKFTTIGLTLDQNGFAYGVNCPVMTTDATGDFPSIGNIIIGVLSGVAFEYIGSVLSNLIDCFLSGRKITSKILNPFSGSFWNIISTILSFAWAGFEGAIDFACNIGLKWDVVKAVGSALVTQLLGLLNKRAFSFTSFIKDVIWNLVSYIAFKRIEKKLTPKKGKEFNKKVRATLGVKGQRNYDKVWNDIVKKLSKKMYFVSSIVDTVKNAINAIIELLETFLINCLTSVVDKYVASNT